MSPFRPGFLQAIAFLWVAITTLLIPQELADISKSLSPHGGVRGAGGDDSADVHVSPAGWGGKAVALLRVVPPQVSKPKHYDSSIRRSAKCTIAWMALKCPIGCQRGMLELFTICPTPDSWIVCSTQVSHLQQVGGSDPPPARAVNRVTMVDCISSFLSRPYEIAKCKSKQKTHANQ